jgi:large subunit ribosomal protein L18
MKKNQLKLQKRIRRHAKIRSQISGTATTPRLSFYKSNKSISVQIIDDTAGKTLVSAHSREVKGKSMMEKSVLVGESIASKAKAAKITKVIFDRGGFIYTGNVKALADAARKGGLQF